MAQELPFVVVVNASNPVVTLETTEVARIFVNKLNRWEDGTEIIPVDQKHLSPVRAAFTEAVYGKTVNAIKAYWQRYIFSGRGRPPEELESDAEVLARVRAQPGAIGYVSPDALPAEGVKVLHLAGLRRDRVAAGLTAQPFQGSADPPAALPTPANALTLGERGELYVSTAEGGLLRSFDGGRVWQALDLGRAVGAIREVLIHPRRPEAVFVGTDTALLLSTDGGISFRSIGVPRGVRRLFVDPTQPGVLEILSADGTFWRRAEGEDMARERTEVLRSAAGRVAGHVGAFAIHPAGLLRAASVEGRVLWSSDGRLWEPRAEVPATVVDLAFRPDARDILFVATTEGLWRTTNGGSRFEQTPLVEPLRRIVASNEALYALSSSSLWVGDREGLRWRRVATVDDGELVVDPRDPARLVLLGREGEVVSTEDGGRTWTRHDTTRRPLVETFGGNSTAPEPAPAETLNLRCGRDGSHVAALATVPGEMGRVYAGGLHGIWRSDDAGQTWKFSGQGLELTDVHALAVDPKRSEIIWAGTHGGGLYRSTDEGANWRRIAGPAVVHALAVDPLVTDTVWVGTPDGLWITEDDGETWRFADSELLDAGDAGPGSLRVRDVLLDAGDPLMARAAARGLREGDAVSGNFGAGGALLGLGEDREIVGEQCGAASASDPLTADDLAAMALDPTALPIRALAFDAAGERLFAATPFGLWMRDGRGAWRRLRLDANLTSLARIQAGGEALLLAGATDGIWQARRGGFGAALDEGLRQTGDGRLARERRPGVFAAGAAPFKGAVFALAADASETFYAGLDRGRVVVARHDPVEDAFVWRLERLPASAPRKVARNADPSGIALSGARTDAGGAARTGTSTPVANAELWWQRLVATPRHDVRRRALLATELLAQLPGSEAELARALLEDPLEELADPPSSLRFTDPSERGTFRGLSFSPDGRWLLAEHRFADHERFHSELRLYDLAAVAETVPRGGMVGGAPGWWAIHDLALEPVHLQPLWILPDAGDVLAWSPDGSYLLTHAEVGRLVVWHLGALPPGAGGPVPSPSVALGRSIEAGSELATELVGRLAPTLREVLDAAAEVLARRGTPRVEVPELVGRAVLSHDGQRIAFPGRDADGALLHVLVPSGQAHALHSLRVPGDVPPHPLQFTRDDAWLLSFSRDEAGTGGAARAWRLATWLRPSPPGAEPRQAPEPFHVSNQIYGDIALSADGRWLATRAGGDLTLWNLSEWDREAAAPALPGWKLLAATGLTPPRFAQSGDWLSASTRSGESVLWRLDGEGPTRVLTVTTDGRLPLFGEAGFQLQGLSSSYHWRLDELPLRQEVRVGAAGAVSPLRRWASWHHEWIRGTPDEPVAPRLRSANNAWHAALRDETLWLWHLAPLDPGGLLGRIGRYGPVNLHLDEGPPPEKARGVGGFGERPIGELRDLACQLVGEGLTRSELRRLESTVAWDSICVLRVEEEE